MRRLSLVLCLCLFTVGNGASARAGQVRRSGQPPTPLRAEPVDVDRLDRLERWLKAVARHTPGADDDALAEVASWPNTNLRALWIDASALVQMIRNVKTDRFLVHAEGQSTPTQVRYSRTQLRRLHLLACAAGGLLVEADCMDMKAADDLDPELRHLARLARAARLRGDDNYILRRGALLHGDVGVIAPLAMFAPPPPPSSSPGPERFRIEISDGREIDLHQSAVHWEIARMLLDFVRPRGSDHADPGRDEMVRQWYRATAAWRQLREDHDKLHLDRARELFPADPDILFLSACQRETYAGAPIQAAVRSAVLPTGVTLDVASDRAELRRAAALFRSALDINLEHAEARLRYGRVLGVLGRHADAAIELRRAAAALQDGQLQYYAGLFLGAEEEALGNRDAARAAYDSAALLYPKAQAPLLGLGELARRHGDRAAALGAMNRLFALQDEDRSELDDPWWRYYVAQARDAGALLAEMWRPFLSEGER